MKTLLLLLLLIVAQAAKGQADSAADENTVFSRIPPPPGFVRVTPDAGSFGEYLQHFPITDTDTPARYFNGKIKADQRSHAAILDIEVKDEYLQCADAVMYLYAHYLYSRGEFQRINFLSAGGVMLPFVKEKYSISNFLQYVYKHANTASLYTQSNAIPLADLQIGDIFITPASSQIGHVVIVMDMAYNPQTGEKEFLLAQGSTPAQSIHITRNPNMPYGRVWYSMADITANRLVTTFWVFGNINKELRRLTLSSQLSMQ